MLLLIALFFFASASQYIFEAERVRADANGKVLSRNWVRIRADGAHETTEGMAVLPFITSTRVEHPDWRTEFWVDLLWFIKRDAGKTIPSATRAARNCVLDRETTVLRTETVEGYEAVVVRRRVLSDRQITNWFVPALGCESLRSTEEIIQPDGTTRLVSQTTTAWVRKHR